MGPKTMHAKTLRRLTSAGVRRRVSPREEAVDEHAGRAQAATPQYQAPTPDVSSWHGSVPLSILERYLDIYHGKMYHVWPVVGVEALLRHMSLAPGDVEAYMLASSICTATILQLQLVVEGSGMPNPQSRLDEIERIRYTTSYRRKPTLYSLLTSFFLHISYLHMEQQPVSTLLLREAITMAHLLELHQPTHYANLDRSTVQAHLRIIWLLFVTERGHARQYDLPCTATISPLLPKLQKDDSLPDASGFACLCNMFACFDNVDSSRNLTAQDMLAADSQLVAMTNRSRSYNSVQQADLLVTHQWMRLLLWKTAVSRLAMTSEPSGTLDSIVFPVQAARDLLSSISTLSMDALEAHGPGMELKLFTMATSLADVMTCLPTHSTVVSEFGARDCLLQMSGMLQTFRGGTEAVMSVLRQRFVEVGLDRLPTRSITEVNWASDDSDFSQSPMTDTPASAIEHDDDHDETSNSYLVVD